MEDHNIKIEKVAVSPSQVRNLVQAADNALTSGFPYRCHQILGETLSKLDTAHAAQDAALDEATRTPEQRAPAETPPLGGTESEPPVAPPENAT